MKQSQPFRRVVSTHFEPVKHGQETPPTLAQRLAARAQRLDHAKHASTCLRLRGRPCNCVAVLLKQEA